MREIHADTAKVAPTEADAYKLRWTREKRARLEAEELIERRSGELYEAHKQLEQVLSGTVKLLTDVLAMARPEVFEKAGKVQRWARRISPMLDIPRPWELDLASMLYPLGVLALPDELSAKYSRGESLTKEERALLAESSQSAYSLLINIPRMETVANAVLYCRKCFDGSGYPADGLKGDNLPKSARVLKVLIDLADDSTGVGRKRDFRAMTKRKHLYDPDIFQVAIRHLKRSVGQPDGEGELLSLSPEMLRPNDVLNRDVVDIEDQLILSAGATLTEITIRRLLARQKNKLLNNNLEVIRN